MTFLSRILGPAVPVIVAPGPAPLRLADCEYPGDLRRLVGEPELSPAWAAVHRAAYARPPRSRAEVSRYRSISRTPWPTGEARAIYACVGRRGLKSTSNADLACYEALCVDHSAHVAEASRLYFVTIAPSLRQAKEASNAIRSRLGSLQAAGHCTFAESGGAHGHVEFTLQGGRATRVIAIFSASDVSIRGFAIACLILDEAGHFRSEDRHAVTLESLIKAARPGMAQFPRSKLVLSGTPGAPHGAFYDAVEDGKTPAGSLVVRGATWQFNPRLPREQCEASAIDARHFAQEFEAARWGMAGETFLPADDVAACFGDSIADRSFSGPCVVGLDFAAVHDSTCIVVARRDLTLLPRGGELDRVVVVHCEFLKGSKAKPLSVAHVAERISELRAIYPGIQRVVHDNFVGHEIRRALAAKGIAAFIAPMNPRDQTSRWVGLSTLIQEGRLLVTFNSELRAQLTKLVASELASGFLKVEAPGKSHDDGADALALACEAAKDLPPTSGNVRPAAVSVKWDGQRLHVDGAGYVRIDGEEDGRLAPAPWPVEPSYGTPEFVAYAKDAERRGLSTPAIERWRAGHR